MKTPIYNGFLQSDLDCAGHVLLNFTGGGSGSNTTVVSVAYSATIDVDATGGGTIIVQVGTLTGNVTLANPTNPSNRQKLEYVLKQDGNGGRSLTLGSKFRFPSSSSLSSPINSSNSVEYVAANKKTRLMVEYDSADDKWDLIAFVPGY